MNVHIIQHEDFEAPGAYLEWAVSRKHAVTFSKVYLGQPLPETVTNIDLLLIMGGPQSPDTTIEECPHFDAKAEIDLIQNAVKNNKAVIGVCLGSQLIGEALGASFENSPEKEIGVFPIQLTADGITDPKINHFGSELAVGHWHNDMPGLTAKSKILASSKGCPRQIISYSDLVYGFQCHMELNPEVAELLIAIDEEFLSTNTKHQFVQNPDTIRSFDFTEMNRKLFDFLDKLEAAYQEKQS
ncbi:type 1 glutamine amidotransferase [Flavobacterium hungaricum]|uniref:Glutamine amidotransferase n=1 Tax=Flavobacterium hungaricum TaxID=2082725 RepID=A0ABR9TRH8_9FLAO|nr:type 1 glutamine amidotransferase [Flavobacterium hungaricum]MBE8727936.1 glutamine amidotransferase [Flavobacterium hungaricum]